MNRKHIIHIISSTINSLSSDSLVSWHSPLNSVGRCSPREPGYFKPPGEHLRLSSLLQVTSPSPGEDSLGSVFQPREAGLAGAPFLPGTFWNFVASLAERSHALGLIVTSASLASLTNASGCSQRREAGRDFRLVSSVHSPCPPHLCRSLPDQGPCVLQQKAPSQSHSLANK